MDKVHAKWGFGNAPLKETHRAKTERAIRVVTAILEALPQQPTADQLDAISHVKGQFSRVLKQDQWDWSTVWALLGRPSRQPANKIAKSLGRLRAALTKGDLAAAGQAAAELNATDVIRYFDNFMAGGREHSRQSGTKGFLYIVSTRDRPQLLKIGMTQRTAEVRVKEVNAATGVAVPYGIRAAWRVDDAARAEKEIHALLDAYRVRTDREFFEIDFAKAFLLINDHLGMEKMFKALERAKRWEVAAATRCR